MAEDHCPNCGAPIAFRSADLPVKVCDYCHSTIVREGGNLQNMGKVAEVPDDVSPLQIGVRGRFGSRGFELIGRVRWRYADGAWNEWLALFDDGASGWLGESMVRYMLLREIDKSALPPSIAAQVEREDVAIGTAATIQGVDYKVADVEQVTVVASEGELSFQAPPGLGAISIDLMAQDGRCATIQKDSTGETDVYVGRYVTLEEICATGLRSFEGWPMPAYRA